MPLDSSPLDSPPLLHIQEIPFLCYLCFHIRRQVLWVFMQCPNHAWNIYDHQYVTVVPMNYLTDDASNSLLSNRMKIGVVGVACTLRFWKTWKTKRTPSALWLMGLASPYFYEPAQSDGHASHGHSTSPVSDKQGPWRQSLYSPLFPGVPQPQGSRGSCSTYTSSLLSPKTIWNMNSNAANALRVGRLQTSRYVLTRTGTFH